MKKSVKRYFGMGIALLILFALWTALVMTTDVRPCGQNGTNIGLAWLNLSFHKLTGVHMEIYHLTDLLSIIPILVCLIFAALGLCQLLKRKSIFKVDTDILLLGLYYAAVVVLFVVFEKAEINYRPILIDGRLEASYPSSTTLLIMSIMPTLVFEINRRVKSLLIRNAATVTATAFSVFMVVGRLLCGVHWLSDIIGGIFLSVGLFFIFKAAVLIFTENR